MNSYSIVSTPDAQNLRGQLEQHLQRYEQMKQTHYFDKEHDQEKKPQNKMIRIESILNELKQKKNFNSNKLLLNEQSSKYFGTDRQLLKNPSNLSVKQQIPSFVLNSNRKKLFFTDGTLNSTQQQSNLYGDQQKNNEIAQDGVLFSFQFNKGYFEQVTQLKSVESKSLLIGEERASSRNSTTNKCGREPAHSQFGESKQNFSNKENCNSNNKVRQTPFKQELSQQKKSFKKFMEDQSQKRSFIKLSSIYDFSKQQVNIPKNTFSIYKKCGSSGDVQIDQRDYQQIKSHSTKPSENQLKKYLSENQKSSGKRKEPHRLNRNEQTYSQIFDQKKQRQLSWMK